MGNYLIKALAYKEQVRVFLVNAPNALNEAIKRHDVWPSAASCLGKIMTMGLFLGANLKGDEAVTVKYNAEGPIGSIVVDANANGDVRGYVQSNHINFVNNDGGLNEAMTLGNAGFLDVIKDLHLKDFFTSSVEATGNIANDFTKYYVESEQTPTLISLGTLIDVNNLAIINGGILIQLLPNATEEAINYIESKYDILKKMSSLLQSSSLEEILSMIFEDGEIVGRLDIKFSCPCNKDRFKEGLLTLSKKDLEEMINDNKPIETICHYCGEKYEFSVEELKEILKQKGSK
ncbi:MAG: Hsp33 family molecular chaperone HslO [Bacilli bacterium]|nr:Hsp33 family molecular chaperone HslO [Bacilli bacterium]